MTLRHTKHETEKFLGGRRNMHLSTVSKNGAKPHVVPVWYMYEEGAFFVGTNSKTAKAKNISYTGRAAFCIDTGVNSPDIFGVAGQGTAKLITGDAVSHMAKRILARYYDGDIEKNPAAQELLADTDCIISIIPEHMTSWSY